MPYISLKERREVRKHGPRTAGQLNFIISSVIDEYVMDSGLNYQVIAEITAAVHGALGEFNDRIVRPYEDAKIEENGDVFVASNVHLEAALSRSKGVRKDPSTTSLQDSLRCGGSASCGVRMRLEPEIDPE